MARLLTISDLRRLTGEARHRLNYALDRYGPDPVDRIGQIRVWRVEDLPRVEESLAKLRPCTPHGEAAGK